MRFPRPLTLFAAALVLCLGAGRMHAADDKSVTISTDDKMKFSVTEITIKVGQRLTIALSNDGSIMAHNLVILKPGTDVAAFVDVAEKRGDDAYLPDEPQSRQMLIHTKLLDGGDSDKISFTPLAPGVYEYVCTYPGHLSAGMRGKIIVN